MAKKAKVEVVVEDSPKKEPAKKRSKKDGRGRKPRTSYQKALVFVAKLFGAKLKAYLLKRVF